MCSTKSIAEVQSDFLRVATGVIERTGNRNVYELVRKAAKDIKQRAEKSDLVMNRSTLNLAHAFHKCGAVGIKASDFNDIFDALKLYDKIINRYDAYLLTRVAAVFRDLGFPDMAQMLSEKIIDIERKKGNDTFFVSLEYIKSLRWQGFVNDAIRFSEEFLDNLVDATDTYKPGVLTSISSKRRTIRDELSKAYVSAGRIDDSVKLLEKNVEEYAANRLTFFSERCERWIGQKEGAKYRKEYGILEDEWMKDKRTNAIGQDKLKEIKDLSQQIYAKILQFCESQNAMS